MIMKELGRVIALLALWSCLTVSPSHGTAPPAEPLPAESSTVTGEVLMITGAYYLTQDAQGRD
ncbi:MAG: hypothetical protein ACREIK_02940, partial [Nitrospiraceae bacterium]